MAKKCKITGPEGVDLGSGENEGHLFNLPSSPVDFLHVVIAVDDMKGLSLLRWFPGSQSPH